MFYLFYFILLFCSRFVINSFYLVVFGVEARDRDREDGILMGVIWFL
jgi:hypothetical protein